MSSALALAGSPNPAAGADLAIRFEHSLLLALAGLLRMAPACQCMTTDFETCPDCGARLPRIVGPTHRYLGASASCWAVYTSLLINSDAPVAPAPLAGLMVDAYCAQHPGVPGPQAIQSVGIHTLVLHGVFERGVSPDNALWIRNRALRDAGVPKHGKYIWLTPPSFAESVTVADIANASTPSARAAKLDEYVRGVWALWSRAHGPAIARWYEAFVAKD
jgi:hypothetical protein